MIPGDGIGPEVTRAVVKVLEAAGFTPAWDTFAAGAAAVDTHGTTLPQELLDSIRKNKIALKGPITTPVGTGFTSVNVGLRKALDLYANVRPIKALPNVPCRYPELDLVIVRENTESLYAGLEHVVVPGVVSGPLSATLFLLIDSIVASGMVVPNFSKAYAPIICVSHSISTPEASIILTVAAMISGPMPSPGIKVIICFIDRFTV